MAEKYEQGKRVVDEIPGYYKLEGDDFWYTRMIGPGPDVPMRVIGNGRNPDPRKIGPRPDGSPLLNESTLSLEELAEKLNKDFSKSKGSDSE